MSGFMDFTFGSGDNNIGQKSKRFKAREGETYRVSFVSFQAKDDGTPDLEGGPQFKGCERIYKEGIGYVLASSPEVVRLLGSPPKQTVATVICVWPTDKKGNLDKASFARGEGWEVMPWVFSADRYTVLQTRHEEFPLPSHDLKLVCTDTQYQKMDISPLKNSLFRTLLESDKEALKDMAKAIFDKASAVHETLENEMARSLTLDEIREKLGGSPSSPVDDAAVADVDGMLDNLLD